MEITFLTDFTIGSFNTLNLNLISNNEQKKDFQKLASIIITENFDIIALQETVAEIAIKQLMRYLPHNWSYCWGQEPSRSSDGKKNSAKGFTFIWNTSRFNESSKDSRPQFEPVKGTIVRRPYLGRFIPVNGPFIEIRLIRVCL